MSRGVGSDRKFFSRLGLILSISSLTTADVWASLAAALKHGIRNPESGNGNGIMETETETEYGIRNTESVKEGSKRSI